MNWSRPADVRIQVQRLWDKGDILRALLGPGPQEALFPRRLTLRAPSSGELTERFEAARAWIGELRQLPHCRLEMREFRHRTFGANAMPCAAWVDTLDDAVALLGKRREVERFSAIAATTRATQPLELHDAWDRLLAIVGWLQQRPRPGVYLRQVDLPGVHTKFIEAHRGVLAELLDLSLPPGAIASEYSGIHQFSARYGFLDKPLRIRFRILDRNNRTLPGNAPTHDVTLDADSFAALAPGVSRVFITENEINFLAFPEVTDSLVIFGAGYGFSLLAGARWLSDCRLYYWGDIDTHGFAMLSQLRGVFGHAESLLMDRETLIAFEAQWGVEDSQMLRDLPGLNAAERALYDDLRDNRIRKNLRLEQERIGFEWVRAAVWNIVRD
ncbi:Wadjet anti-phage system protein JetD domain-containing protein [Cupriavidus sp. amp6]|uniref:Wadjet anti-phage system protein JetD domain-containing protein n=1 Tax=Cupriavidus sp. amp6 TaxID=388051 RepID=UPI0004073BCF|nr:Wadjet anti-phage system protein JetD domain-containing protein [Cupriavidus sp. amp6]